MIVTFKHEGATDGGTPYGPVFVEGTEQSDSICDHSRPSLGPDGCCQKCGGYVWLTLPQAEGFADHYGYELEES